MYYTLIMNRWELDKELDYLKQQGFSEEQAYCVIACMERENEEYEQGIIESNKKNDTRTSVRQVA